MATTDSPVLSIEASSKSTAITELPVPHIVKYMGSKKPILTFVTDNIAAVAAPGETVCDLFAGSCSISSILRNEFNFYSNDIQDYSRILGEMYFSDLSCYDADGIIHQVLAVADCHLRWFGQHFGELLYDYSAIHDLDRYQDIESNQRSLFEGTAFDTDFHLFTKYYSGTYWSFEQCASIDALRKAAQVFDGQPIFYAILSSIMYAMSYTTQSTGHFAQYRDGNTVEAMKNILIYRRKDLVQLFVKKLRELIRNINTPSKRLVATTMGYGACLEQLPERITVYADPPYAPVHYSRFYHALETLVKYDYPNIEHKGRYRMDRHQSPFSQKSNALNAFGEMFDGVACKDSQLVLSYSGSGVVAIEDIQQLAAERFNGSSYAVTTKTLDHKHSTMGRFEDHERDVIEYLIIAKKK
jgi:adenine-specific DNA-methyltransferase